MEKEVSHAVEIGVTLIIIAAFMGLVFFTVSMGSTLKQDSHNYAVELSDSVSIKALDDLMGKETEVPMATAYNLIAQYSGSIGELACYYCAAKDGSTNIEDYVVNPSEINNVCLARHLYGKCIMKVSKNAGYYQIYIHSSYGATYENGHTLQKKYNLLYQTLRAFHRENIHYKYLQYSQRLVSSLLL